MSLDQLRDLVPSAGGFSVWLLSLASAVAILRRRLSRDNTEMSMDRSESSFMSVLRLERDAAAAAERQAYANRASDLQAIARLEAMNLHQCKEIERLKREFAAFKRLVIRMYPDAARFLSSQSGDFQDTER